VGGSNISKYGFSTEIVEGLGRIESKSDTELKLERQVKALEERLRESENARSDQKVRIGDVQANLCELNRNIKDLENRANHMEVAMMVLGILFISSIIIVYYTYQGYDLFTSYYITGKAYLDALLANPIFHSLQI
jgi:hypothetical protein